MAAAFEDAIAGDDADVGADPVRPLFRYLFQERLRGLLPAGARVADLACGTGEDALFLAARGITVIGFDGAPDRVQRARDQAEAHGLADRVRFEVGRPEELGRRDGPFDGAYCGLRALEDADLTVVGERLAAALRPGAPVLLCLVGRYPLPAMIDRALTARGQTGPERRSRATTVDARIPTVDAAIEHPTRREAQRRFGTAFHWRAGFALGVLVPCGSHAAWIERHPLAFGVLAALEGLVRRAPLLRSLGAYVVLEGVRR